MKDKFFLDLGRIMDEIFTAAEDFGHAMKDGLTPPGGFHWDETIDFYPAYSYPPTNVFMNKDRLLTFEFALSGFKKESLELQFQGDYMILSAKADTDPDLYKDVKFFKRRLKLKDITTQKYFVPAAKFDREKVKASFKNGLLRVEIPPKESIKPAAGIKVEINTEEGEK